MIAAISIRRLTLVLPVPVTAFSHTVAMDMLSIPTVTILITGIASTIKSPFEWNMFRKCSDFSDKSFHFIFFILPDHITYHRIGGAGKCP
jgi:hypothetical protein